jgi:hypothetical protein
MRERLDAQFILWKHPDGLQCVAATWPKQQARTWRWEIWLRRATKHAHQILRRDRFQTCACAFLASERWRKDFAVWRGVR